MEEAAFLPAKIRWILHDGRLNTGERSAVNRLAAAGAEVLEVTPDVLRACSDTTTPPGLMAVLEWPDLPMPAPLAWAVVADGISNPGNLGSLLRAAEAFAVQALLLAPGCVDPFNPKVVRGAMGAHLRLPIWVMDWREINKVLQGFRIYLAEAREGQPVDRIDWNGPVALVLGGEAAGPGEQARSLAIGSVHIPITERRNP